MRLRIGILILAMAASAAWAQMPILDNTRTKLKTATEKNLPENALKNANATGTQAAKPAITPAAVKTTSHSSAANAAASKKVKSPAKTATHKEVKKSDTAKTNSPAAP